jgi:hypothetical protein
MTWRWSLRPVFRWLKPWNHRRPRPPLSGLVPKPDAGKRQEDHRLLVPLEKMALLDRPEPFALRQELCVRITGLTSQFLERLRNQAVVCRRRGLRDK